MSKQIFTPENVFHPALRSILNELNEQDRNCETTKKDIFEELVFSENDKSSSNPSYLTKKHHKERKKYNSGIIKKKFQSEQQQAKSHNTSPSFEVYSYSSFGFCSNIWFVCALTIIIIFMIFLWNKPSFCYQEENHTKKFSWFIALIWSFVIGFLPIAIYFGYNLLNHGENMQSKNNNNSSRSTTSPLELSHKLPQPQLSEVQRIQQPQQQPQQQQQTPQQSQLNINSTIVSDNYSNNLVDNNNSNNQPSCASINNN